MTFFFFTFFFLSLFGNGVNSEKYVDIKVSHDLSLSGASKIAVVLVVVNYRTHHLNFLLFIKRRAFSFDISRVIYKDFLKKTH